MVREHYTTGPADAARKGRRARRRRTLAAMQLSSSDAGDGGLGVAGPGPSTVSAAAALEAGVAGPSAAALLVNPACAVPATLTIRACRNLPLHMLGAEFKRVLQRRHEKVRPRAHCGAGRGGRGSPPPRRTPAPLGCAAA
jgi:hypothetical protein